MFKLVGRVTRVTLALHVSSFGHALTPDGCASRVGLDGRLLEKGRHLAGVVWKAGL